MIMRTRHNVMFIRTLPVLFSYDCAHTQIFSSFLTRVSMHLIFCQGNFIFERRFLLSLISSSLIFSNYVRLSATVLDCI